MTTRSTRPAWLRSVWYGVLAQVIALGVAMIVVAGYAAGLAFQARGRPEQVLINHFAAASSRWVMAIAGIVVTLLLAHHLVRRAPRPSVPLGMVVGLSSAVVSAGVALAFQARIGLGFAFVPLLLLLVGWLGALRGSSASRIDPRG
jgi:hypothetical protein